MPKEGVLKIEKRFITELKPQLNIKYNPEALKEVQELRYLCAEFANEPV